MKSKTSLFFLVLTICLPGLASGQSEVLHSGPTGSELLKPIIEQNIIPVPDESIFGRIEPSNCPVNVCIAQGGNSAEKAALINSLTTLGFNVIQTNSVIGQNCTVAATYPSTQGLLTVPLSWVQAGNGCVQISDHGPDHISNSWTGIAENSNISVIIQDPFHPIAFDVSSTWTSKGFWRYGYAPSDFIGWATSGDPNLASAGGYGKSLSARNEGSGKLVYIGWNVIGTEATDDDLKILRNSIIHASGQIPASCAGAPDTDGDGIVDEEDNCPDDANTDQADNDDDGYGDACDDDDDNDGISDEDEIACDSDPLNANSTCEVCDGEDNNLDGSTDEGFTDTDGDELADCVDDDDDNDGVADRDDSDPLNNFVCQDSDGDGCDDCSSGYVDAANDGLDTDGDGLCNAGDPDDDNDGVADGDDSDPLDNFVCQDSDGDGCDDCSSGYVDAANDGLDTDGDGLCNAGDNDDDNDGILDNCDSEPLIDNYTYTGFGNLPASWICGNNNNKVLMCHGGNNPQTNCVSPNAVQTHLNHGDYLGECTCTGESRNFTLPGNTGHSATTTEQIEVYPNPASDMVNIHLHGLIDGDITLLIYDQLGKVVLSQNLDEATNQLSIELPSGKYSAGLYFVRATSGQVTLTERLMIAKK